MNTDERVYTSKHAAGWGLSVWREMVNEAVSSRELTWRLFMRDFSVRYRQMILGVVWTLITPLISMATFVVLNRSGLLKVGDIGVPYPIFVLLGLTVWQLFAGGLSVASNAVVAGGSMVVKINFPKETLVLAAMGQVIFEFLVRLAMLAILMAVFHVVPKWTAVFFPVMLLPIFIFVLGLGLFLSLSNVLFRDVSKVVGSSTTLLLFFTPVLYNPPESGLMATIMRINPLSWLVTAPRDIIIKGYLTDSTGFIWSAGLALVMFFVAWRIFHLVEYKMAEVI
ncbi:MAG: ABC transporter permease [Candidatus Hodarchaeota archaeon]